MTMKHWVRFEGKPYGRDRSRPRVTIGPQKALLLNPAAYGMLGSPDAVEMYYDELRKTIGLKRSHESREYAFPVRKKKNSKYMVVYVGAFCNHFQIEITHSVEFNDLALDREGILELQLTKATGVRRGAR
jgi:hypothetical protein